MRGRGSKLLEFLHSSLDRLGTGAQLLFRELDRSGRLRLLLERPASFLNDVDLELAGEAVRATKEVDERRDHRANDSRAVSLAAATPAASSGRAMACFGHFLEPSTCIGRSAISARWPVTGVNQPKPAASEATASFQLTPRLMNGDLDRGTRAELSIERIVERLKLPWMRRTG